MSNLWWAGFAVFVVVGAWLENRRAFRRGYDTALDHVDFDMRFRLGSVRELDVLRGVIRKLRKENGS